jgi:hypothetical protein
MAVCEKGLSLMIFSLHCGKTNGLVPKIWPEHNRAGFDALQRTFIDFTHHCFSKNYIFRRGK